MAFSSCVDTSVVGLSGLSFVFFFLVHAAASRFLKTDQVFKTILLTSLIGLLGNILLTTFFFLHYFPLFSGLGILSIVVLSLAIDGLMVFGYVICIWGPFETSIRMRIVRELYEARPQGLSETELLRVYNTRGILKIRLRRLVGAGDIQMVNGKYRIIQRQNVFFIIDRVAGVLKKWTSPSLKGRG